MVLTIVGRFNNKVAKEKAALKKAQEQPRVSDRPSVNSAARNGGRAAVPSAAMATAVVATEARTAAAKKDGPIDKCVLLRYWGMMMVQNTRAMVRSLNYGYSTDQVSRCVIRRHLSFE